MNEQAFQFFSVLSGYSLYALVYTSKDSFDRIFMKKYFGIMPLLLCLMAIEVQWPVIGSGPLYSRVGKQILHDCNNNWWRHIALVGNESPEEACIGHTFFTSANLQLMFLGLLTIHLLHKNKMLGIIFAVSCSIVSLVKLFFALEGVKTPVLLSPNMKFPDSANYLMRVHFPTYPHIPCFFVGLLTCFFLKKEGYRAYSHSWYKTMIHASIVGFLLGITSFSPALHNIYHLIPFQYYPHYILFFKILFISACPLIITLASFAPFMQEEDSKEKSRSHPNESRDENNFSITQGLERLSFSMHLINYFYIKYDFLSSRTLMDMDAYNLVKRAASSMVIIIILGLFFHILFIAPINGLVNTFILNKRPVDKNKQN